MRLFAIQAMIRRLAIGADFRSAMASMGGVGSTALARHIGSIADKTVKEHAYSPRVFDQYDNIKLGYIYGNPYNAVLSVFRRGYQHMHVRAMNADSGTEPKNLEGISLEEFLAQGKDEFYMERQFDNWTSEVNPKHPIILIKYEALADHIGEILDFFGTKDPFEVKERKSSWLDQPESIRKQLEKVYGGLFEKVEAMPSIKIISPNKSA
ncbi:beta/alpha barrel domain-containing protein [Methylosarcina fibrata]|uniref:hypothetical protein n=1 Tax=Methylosarcina fibrata TaxID=105972 RepID=UPI00037CF91B|nr:hypothetical protein [Methylosarcina fibrata]